MAENFRTSGKRLRSSYLSTVASISLVLFLLGMLGILLLHAHKLSDYVKENIEISVILREDAREADIQQLKKTIDSEPYIRSTEYITSQEAAEKLKSDLGEDFIAFLGYNPLLSSIDARLKANYANNDSLIWIEKKLTSNPLVSEVFYQKSLVDLINDNLRTIGMVILIFCGILFLISLALINNTIRLAMYSRRFLIKSMQLVGATRSFIRRPFIYRGILHGIYGAVIAIALLTGVLYLAQKQVPELFVLQDIEMIGSLFGGVMVLGILISWLSTLFAVGKYLRLKLDDLY